MNLRLFIALEPPEPVLRKLSAMQATLRRALRGPDVKWVAPEGIHLTLQFLGAVPEERLERIQSALAEAAAGSRPLLLEVKGAGGFPNARRARVLWAGIAGDVEPLSALAADLGRRLAPLGYPPEERAFSPHLTLGRARDPHGIPGLGGALTELAAGDGVSWRGAELCLVRSHLSPTGARYEVTARAPLGGVRP